MTLSIDFQDILRATLAEDCGNIGFLGVAPDGSAYHVVVPVDLQIARGVKARNLPADGTPFGGYRGWLYFPCPPYPVGPDSDRKKQARSNAALLRAWAVDQGLDLVTSPPAD
jgi:hypothetical protein